MQPSDATAAARAIVDANKYMTLATADTAGTPWASPVWFAHDGYTEFLWVSRPSARHSHNIAGRPEVGIVIFDSTVAEDDAKAVYVEGVGRMAGDDELTRMMATFSARSEAQGAPPWTAQDVTGAAPHRLYIARASAHFILGAHDQRIAVQFAGGESA